MTRSLTASRAKKFARTAVITSFALAGAATLMAPSTAQAQATAGQIVKVSYSPVLYSIEGGIATQLSFSQWSNLGFPQPATIGNIPGTKYLKYGTSPDVIATPPGATPHKLSFEEWLAAGQPAPAMLGNEGFIKLSWAPEIARMTDLETGAGRPLTFQEWADNGFTSYATQQRIKGDTFYKEAGSDVVYYSGPGVKRAITFAEWVGAGQPTPWVRSQVTATAASGSAWGLIKPVNANVTSEFTLARLHPTLGYVRPHLGIDLGAACGTPIKAARNGVVTLSSYSSGGGNSVYLSHGIVNGATLFTSYLHMIRPGLPVGSVVKQGDIVGYVGSTGASTGCHLHFEVKPNNQAQNPRNFLTF